MFFILTTLLGGILIKLTKIKPISFILILYGIIIGLFHKNFKNNNSYHNSVEYWINLNPNTFLSFFIPPLIYQASFNINYHIFRKTIYLILMLSIFGVLLNITLISSFMYGIDTNFNNFYCLILGSILGAIDPTAVTLLLSELKLSDKLSNLIKGESLLNDEVAILSLYIIKKIFLYDNPSSIIFIESIRLVFGSIFIGGILSLVKIFLLGLSYGDLVSEVTITLIFCYLSYFLSENTIFNTSGILTVVISGLIMAAYGKTRISPKNISKIYDFWDLLASYSNIIIFTLSGVIISNKIVFSHIFYYHWLKLIGLYFFINFIRFFNCLLLYPCLRKNIFHYDYIDFIVLSLSGLRGEISLALSLFIFSDKNIPFEIRNLVLFYVSGIVFLTITINSNILRFIIRYFHRDKISLTTKHLESIKSHIIREGKLYLENLKETDFHLSKVDYNQVEKHLYTDINNNDILLENTPNEDIGKKIYLNTLKKTIWNLFEDNILHYDVIIKLIDIVDSYLDHLDEPWGGYMNDYCQKEHINTSFICFLEKLPCTSYFIRYLIYHRIEYNYNLILGYMYALKISKKKITEIIDNIDITSSISNQVMNALHYPHIYMEHLEEKYGDILVKIETKQMILLVISKHKSHLEYLKKNGEISEKIYETLLQKFNKKEHYLKRNII